MRMVIALGLAALATGCTAPIQHGLDEPAANEVVAALESAGVGTEKVAEESGGGQAAGFTVRVSRADEPRALDVLRALGLPRTRRSGFAEVYGQPSLIPSASEERARYLEALGGEIERTLETVDGVTAARVHLVLAEVDPLSPDGKPRVPARAAVLLKARAGRPPLEDADVQRLVAGSVPGLEPASVAVVVTAVPEAAEARATALSAVGPFRVSPGSRPALLAAMGGALGLLAVLAVMLMVTGRRLTAAQRGRSPQDAE